MDVSLVCKVFDDEMHRRSEIALQSLFEFFWISVGRVDESLGWSELLNYLCENAGFKLI